MTNRVSGYRPTQPPVTCPTCTAQPPVTCPTIPPTEPPVTCPTCPTNPPTQPPPPTKPTESPTKPTEPTTTTGTSPPTPPTPPTSATPATPPTPPPPTPPPPVDKCVYVPEEQRIDCHPEIGASSEACQERGCCWNDTRSAGEASACYFPPSYIGYDVQSVTETEDKTVLLLTRKQKSGLPRDAQLVRVEVTAIDNMRVRVKIDDPSTTRFEVGLPPLQRQPVSKKDGKLFRVDVYNGLLKILRKSTNAVVIRMDLTKLIFSDQFIQLTNVPPANSLYGLGEHRASFRKEIKWQRYTMLNSDRVSHSQFTLLIRFADLLIRRLPPTTRRCTALILTTSKSRTWAPGTSMRMAYCSSTTTQWT